jgi:DNA polymerase III delta prime subunit
MSDSDSAQLWVEKYRPTKLEHIVGQDKALKRLQTWIEAHQRNDEEIKRCVLLTGPPGLGKTTMALCLLNHYGYDVREFNASDIRTKSQIEESFYKLIYMKRVRSKKPIAIIMDEIDGMSGGKNGGLTELTHYINPNRGKGNQKKENRLKEIPLPPIICIRNNANEKKLQDFRKDCLELVFKSANHQDLRKLLNRICKAEDLKLNEEAKELILEYAQADYRRLINYLQSLSTLILDPDYTLGVAEIEQVNQIIGNKTTDLDMENSFHQLLTTNDLDVQETLRLYNNHKSQYICTIYENYIDLLTHRNDLKFQEKFDRMKRIIDYISWSDIVDKSMKKSQLYYLQKIHGLLSCHLPLRLLYQESFQGFNHYTSSWSMFNLQKSNEKELYHLASRMKTTTGTADVQLVSQIALHYLLDDPSSENVQKGVNLLKAYDLASEDIKILKKIDRISTHKKLSAKMDKDYKKYFPPKSEIKKKLK